MTAGSETNKTINVVSVENADAAHSELHRLLSTQADLKVGHAAGWEQLKSELDDGYCDVVVIHGAGAGNESAAEINEKVKSQVEDPPATILYYGQESVAAARKAFRCGFTEFLPAEKTTEQELFKTVYYAANIAEDRKREAERIRVLERAAQYDASTGLPNRHYLNDRLQQMVAIAQRYDRDFAIILLQVNEIDDVIARFSNRVAEKVFYSCATTLQQTARSSDTLGRLDTRTFFYIVDNLEAQNDVDIVRARLVEAVTCSLNIDELSITLSAGTAAVRYPANGETVDDLLASARAILAQLIKPAAGSAFADNSAKNQHQHAPADVSAGHGQQPDIRSEANFAQAAPSAVVDDNSVLRAENRRAFQRRRVFKHGAIIFNNGYSKVDCTIKDISDGGARIATDTRFVTPDRLELLVVETGQRYRAEKRWQADRQTGLMFLH